MPGFNKDSYPFILCAGKAEIWISNLKTRNVWNLINASSAPILAQQGMTFLPPLPEEESKNENQISRSRCIFASQEELPSSDNKLYQVYEMNFLDDFK